MKRAKDSLGVLTINEGYAKNVIETKSVSHISEIIKEISNIPEILESIETLKFFDCEEFTIVDEKTNKTIGYVINLVLSSPNTNANE